MHQQRISDSRLSNLCAQAIIAAFERYQQRHHEIIHRARKRFETMDWHGLQADAAERLDLYREIIGEIATEIQELLADRREDKLIWAGLKAVYSGLITGRNDWELAETFFNSVTRRIFTTVGVDIQIEFVDTDFETPPTQARQPIYRSYHSTGGNLHLIRGILKDYPFSAPYPNLENDAVTATTIIEAHLREIGALKIIDRVEVVDAVFYRGKSAHIVGRIFSGTHIFPLVLVLMNETGGIFLDAVLLTENEASIVFSFTRASFHVAVERPYDLVQFLKSVMPRKRLAELYISIGFHKHGKTELFRDIFHHLARSDGQFVVAPGKKGMVMIVFTLPGYDVVFKLIRDKSAYPKKISRQTVLDKYKLVFLHDRAGRMVDAQEFEYLQFEKSRFSEELLEELKTEAKKTVEFDGDNVIIKHAYIERRVIPLDIYAAQAELDSAKAAIIDYGNAIKDLAASNIFTGDMLLKNFGVTRHGRVVFYDYDELCMITECNFRNPPKAPSLDEELSSEPWFSIAENDIFPTEFRHFLGLGGVLLQTFYQHHEDLFSVEFWKHLQERIESGEIIHIFPYPLKKRLQLPPSQQ